ncbi:hypothetical protein HDV02_001598 [Globomyces sp. JEL0801]|nr:hypothetical protein HDV02_001598 [Globomyces sp. JEL0801]
MGRGKPSPDIFLEAAKLIGNHQPENCLVFEDSRSGVEAGLNAKMQVIWVPDSRLPLDDHMKTQCSKVLKTLEDFNPILYGLPPFDDLDHDDSY